MLRRPPNAPAWIWSPSSWFLPLVCEPSCWLQPHRRLAIHPSHTLPVPAPLRCDSEMLGSLDSGIFTCSPDPDTPKSRWCSSHVGRRVCPLGAGFPKCLVTLTFARLYHHWKVATACRVMGMDAVAAQQDDGDVQFHCTCSASF